jgi:hypothetical protein
MNQQTLSKKLLDLASELIIKGDPDSALIVTLAASQLMGLPAQAERLRHPSGKVPDSSTSDINNVINLMYGRNLGEDQ